MCKGGAGGVSRGGVKHNVYPLNSLNMVGRPITQLGPQLSQHKFTFIVKQLLINQLIRSHRWNQRYQSNGSCTRYPADQSQHEK